jgi:hypothetical protein
VSAAARYCAARGRTASYRESLLITTRAVERIITDTRTRASAVGEEPGGVSRRLAAAPTGLAETASMLAARGKGILAADENPKTLAKRFASVGVQCTSETRRE